MDEPTRRLAKFYGLNDYATYFQLEAVSALALDSGRTNGNVNEVLQQHNVMLFLQAGVLPSHLNEAQRAAVLDQVPKLRETVSRYFRSIDSGNVAALVGDVDYQYYDDLLYLFAVHGVIDRCDAATLLPVLRRAGVPLRQMLQSKAFVRTYDAALREEILSTTANAELILQKHLEKAEEVALFLPASLTPRDAGVLISAYIDSSDANPNYLQLIANSKPSAAAGITDKMRLQARRANDSWTKDYFEANPNSGFQTGVQVTTSMTQAEPVTAQMNENIVEYIYSSAWLTENLDYPTILNNFIYVFEFVNQHMQLILPSYQADLGVMERIMGVRGRGYYPAGIAFQHKQQTSLLQVMMYAHVLGNNDIELEQVIRWFFEEYLTDEFGATNFRFRPSSKTASYLERCRHLFSELDSITRQFKLYAENGELDTDLLAMSSSPVRFADIPSLVQEKYVYAAPEQTIGSILHLLFSDQSPLHHIDDVRQAETTVELLRDKTLGLADFHDYQQAPLQFLFEAGVLREVNHRITFVSMPQLLVLTALSKFEAASYLHFTSAARDEIQTMLSKGWLASSSSLFSVPESQYLNYMLNDSEFSDGPALRNNYIHGSQVESDDDAAHQQTYGTVLKLLIALVLKINDDFDLRKGQQAQTE